MKTSYGVHRAGWFFLSGGLAAMAMIALVGRSVAADPPPPPAPGVVDPAGVGDDPAHAGERGPQALDQGPIHEGFAEPIGLDAKAPPIVDHAPPEPVNELPPEVKPEGKNVEWIPGYWMWSDEQKDFVWVSGIWRDAPPGRRWTPGYWTQVAGGWQRISGFWGPEAQGELVFRPVPPQNLDAGPTTPAPAPNFFWVPGCWVWVDGTYAWRAGYWYAGQNDWLWTPDHYCYTPQGVVFIAGFWDRPVFTRGLLFAPVWWPRHYYPQPGWVYRPYNVVNSSLLLSALFINNNQSCYYFGHSRWLNANLQPWYNFPGHGRIYDPLCAYHRWHDGHNQPQWLGNVAGQFRNNQQNFGADVVVQNAVKLPNGVATTLPNRGRGGLVVNVDQLTGNNRTEQAFANVRRASATEISRSVDQIKGWNRISQVRAAGEAGGHGGHGIAKLDLGPNPAATETTTITTGATTAHPGGVTTENVIGRGNFRPGARGNFDGVIGAGNVSNGEVVVRAGKLGDANANTVGALPQNGGGAITQEPGGRARFERGQYRPGARGQFGVPNSGNTGIVPGVVVEGQSSIGIGTGLPTTGRVTTVGPRPRFTGRPIIQDGQVGGVTGQGQIQIDGSPNFGGRTYGRLGGSGANPGTFNRGTFNPGGTNPGLIGPGGGAPSNFRFQGGGNFQGSTIQQETIQNQGGQFQGRQIMPRQFQGEGGRPMIRPGGGVPFQGGGGGAGGAQFSPRIMSGNVGTQSIQIGGGQQGGQGAGGQMRQFHGGGNRGN